MVDSFSLIFWSLFTRQIFNFQTEKSSICSNEAPTNVDRGNGEEFGIEKIEMSLNSAARDNKAVEDHPVDVEENNKNADEDQTKRDEPNEPVEVIAWLSLCLIFY